MPALRLPSRQSDVAAIIRNSPLAPQPTASFLSPRDTSQGEELASRPMGPNRAPSARLRLPPRQSQTSPVNRNAPLAFGQQQASSHLGQYVTGGGACEPTNGVHPGTLGSGPRAHGRTEPGDPPAALRSLTRQSR